MADGGDPRVEEIPPSTEAVEDEEVVIEDEGAESVVDTSDLTTAILRRKVGALSLSNSSLTSFPLWPHGHTYVWSAYE